MLKPNIVLITLDSLRADFVGYLNPKEKNTPFLDSLSKKSYFYTNAICPANPTFFTFCSIMTGSLPFEYGNFLGIPNNKRIKTIAEVLKDKGYSTSAFLADSPALYSIYGYDKGFDNYDDGYDPSSNHSTPGRKLNEKIKNKFSKKQKEPFFTWLHYMDTHLPFLSGLDDYFLQNKTPEVRRLKKEVFRRELVKSVKEMKIKDNETTEIFKEAYRGCVKYADQSTGEIVSFFRKEYPNTVFIIVSDHGEALMEHGIFGHEPYSLYDELIKIPMIINFPSGESVKRTETVSLISLAKTISEIAGINNKNFQGNNLIKDKKFSDVNNITRILYKCRSPHVRLGILDNNTEISGYTELWSFTTPKEKYILEKDGKKEEFYDLSKDPGEKHNLIADDNKVNKTIINELKTFIE